MALAQTEQVLAALAAADPRFAEPGATETVVGRTHGHLYNTIANGIRNMPAYGHQIEVEDRWAIVAYVRALQRARTATLDDVPEENRRTLR